MSILSVSPYLEQLLTFACRAVLFESKSRCRVSAITARTDCWRNLDTFVSSFPQSCWEGSYLYWYIQCISSVYVWTCEWTYSSIKQVKDAHDVEAVEVEKILLIVCKCMYFAVSWTFYWYLDYCDDLWVHVAIWSCVLFHLYFMNHCQRKKTSSTLKNTCTCPCSGTISMCINLPEHLLFMICFCKSCAFLVVINDTILPTFIIQ